METHMDLYTSVTKGCNRMYLTISIFIKNTISFLPSSTDSIKIIKTFIMGYLNTRSDFLFYVNYVNFDDHTKD